MDLYKSVGLLSHLLYPVSSYLKENDYFDLERNYFQTANRWCKVFNFFCKLHCTQWNVENLCTSLLVY